MGFGTIYIFRHPFGILERIPHKEGTTYCTYKMTVINNISWENSPKLYFKYHLTCRLGSLRPSLSVWNNILSIRIRFLVKISFKNEREVKIFSDKNWGDLSVVDLPYNKYLRGRYLKQKKIIPRWKCGKEWRTS